MNFIKSFKCALAGIIKAFKLGRNFRIMSVCFSLVIVFGFIFDILAIEWTILLLCSGVVLLLEMINTSIEKAVDMITTDYNKTAGKVKDIAVGAVLIISIFSAKIALIIFLPYLTGMIDFWVLK